MITKILYFLSLSMITKKNKLCDRNKNTWSSVAWQHKKKSKKKSSTNLRFIWLPISRATDSRGTRSWYLRPVGRVAASSRRSAFHTSDLNSFAARYWTLFGNVSCNYNFYRLQFLNKSGTVIKRLNSIEYLRSTAKDISYIREICSNTSHLHVEEGLKSLNNMWCPLRACGQLKS